MSVSLNQVTIAGNLTRDVELKYTEGGTAVTEIGLAINERRKKGEAWVDVPVFVDVTLWGRTAEVAGEYLSKGSPVLIEGRLRLDTWETEGQKRSKLRVTAERMQMLGSRSKATGKTEAALADATSSEMVGAGVGDNGDDVPL